MLTIPLAALLALSGCAAGSGLFPTDERVNASELDGDWLNDRGDTITLDKTVGGGVAILGSDDRYTGVLIDINGVTVIEVLLSPDLERGNTPVYHYGRLELSGDGSTLTHRPLRADWLKSQAAGTTGITSEQPERAGSVEVAVGDELAMPGLLVRAVATDDAWGEPETLRSTD